MRWTHALLLCSFGIVGQMQAQAQAQAQAQPASEDLLQVWAQALAADPVLAQADAQRSLQQESALQARAALWPQWSLTGTETRSSDDGSRSRSIGSSITQVLFDLGRLREWQATHTAATAQDATLRAAQQALSARVASAYFGVLSAQANLNTAQAIAQAYEREWQAAQQRVAAGLAAAVDMEQSRTYFELARGHSVQAQLQVADARQALAQITGREPAALKPLARQLPAQAPQPADAAAWVTRAVAANPQLQALALSVQASEQRIDSARAASYPSVSAAIDSSRTTGFGSATQTQVALRLTLPLFAAGALQSQTRQATLRRDIAREQLEVTRRAVVRETHAQHQAVSAGVVLLQSTQAAVQASERALASTRSGQALGTRSTSDLLLAIQNLASAQAAHEQTRHAYVLATLLLQQAAGGLGEAELAAVNQLLESL
jgi:outer membrane protein